MSSTTSDLTEFSAVSSGSGRIASDAITGARPAGYAHAAGTSDPLERSPEPRAATAQRPQAKRATTSDRHALAEHLADALSFAKDLETAAASCDQQGAAIAGLDLRNSLRALWKLRHVRSDDWATIVNKLQVVTSKVEFEQFTQDMAVAVRMSIESHLGPDVDNDDIRAVTILLERAGMSPWKCLAPASEEA